MDLPSSPRLRRVKPFHFGTLQDTTSALLTAPGPQMIKRLLRIDFRDPREDYAVVQVLKSNQGILVCRRKNHLHPAVIRESFSPSPLQMLECVAQVQHPNIADIHDVYFYEDHLYIISEYLDISLLDLNFKGLAPEEWEIATIVVEVIKAMTYLLDAVPICKLNVDSVRLSLHGDVKLVPNMHYQSSPDDDVTDHQCNPEFLVKILEVLMSYDMSAEKGWSQEALEFSKIPSSDSLIPSMNHIFLTKAVSPSRLVPRIRLATQLLGCKSWVCPGEYA